MVLSLGTLEFLKNYVTTTWFKNIYIFFLDSKLCLIVSFQQVNPLQHGSAKVLGIQQCSGWEWPEPPCTFSSLEKLLLCHLPTRSYAAAVLVYQRCKSCACQLSRGQNVLHAPLFCLSSVSHPLKDHKLWRTVSSANTVPSSKSVSAIFLFPFQIFSALNAFQPRIHMDETRLSFSDQMVRKLLWSYDFNCPGCFFGPARWLRTFLSKILFFFCWNAPCLLSLFIPLVALWFSRAVMGLSDGTVNPLTRPGRSGSNNMILRAVSWSPGVRQ